MIEKSFWKNKKVLVTGHTGFKGGWLSLWLQHLQADVVGYALPTTDSQNLFVVADIASGMRHIEADILDLEQLQSIIATEKPEIVFHLAAQPLVRKSYQEPFDTFKVNLLGTLNLFEAVKSSDSVKAMINVTSDKCYAVRDQHQAFVESDRLGGDDPYSSSKACAEIISHAYRHSFFHNKLALATVRSGNVIGGGDWSPSRLIPDIVRAWQSGQPISIRYPEAVRPWLHVLDSLSGYLLLAQKLYFNNSEFASSWNFGSCDPYPKSVAWLVQKSQQLGLDFTMQTTPLCDWQETLYLSLNSDKAQRLLKWQQRWRIELALQKTIDWYLALSQQADMRTHSLSQIKEYEGLMNGS